ncbi:Beta-carotene 3-hydroxylase, chloroplastic [Apostasia shenzhenica]|uniref:beta-carotene 3-hydroxylase n=1 Tax=Apostasia shenzhenica TaxID=1088818 RepID=A0A2I0AVP4_9ASPA|nr:Beta-carotene 3-hydroxylase, chloroplastic [Apostasia shenzhenica]
MAAGIYAASTTLVSPSFAKTAFRFSSAHHAAWKGCGGVLLAPLSAQRLRAPASRAAAFFIQTWRKRRDRTSTVCFVLEDRAAEPYEENTASRPLPAADKLHQEQPARISASRAAERAAQKRSERRAYLVAAVMSSFGITSMAVAAVYYRFAWQMEGGDVPLSEMLGTFSLSVGAAVGMEFWARWAHRALWHASLWHMHESHHRPRDGPFELNDAFAIVNAVPAISLLSFGFFHRGLFPGLCFGAGLGITLFGIAYMFVHDGLVHRRFPVGPIANVPYFRRVAAAHQIHHSDKFNGVPYGLFLGPKELEEVGGAEELEREINRRAKLYNSNSNSNP